MTEPRCQSLLNQLSDYIEGQLDEALCTEIEHHLAQCENCRVVVNTLERTITLYRQMPPAEFPPAAQERLFKVLRLEPNRLTNDE